MPGSGDRSPAQPRQESRCLVSPEGLLSPPVPARGWLRSEGVPRQRGEHPKSVSSRAARGEGAALPVPARGGFRWVAATGSGGSASRQPAPRHLRRDPSRRDPPPLHFKYPVKRRRSPSHAPALPRPGGFAPNPGRPQRRQLAASPSPASTFKRPARDEAAGTPRAPVAAHGSPGVLGRPLAERVVPGATAATASSTRCPGTIPPAAEGCPHPLELLREEGALPRPGGPCQPRRVPSWQPGRRESPAPPHRPGSVINAL